VGIVDCGREGGVELGIRVEMWREVEMGDGESADV